MAKYLKHCINPDTKRKSDSKVRQVVKSILADIEDKGDAAVRTYAEKLGVWGPETNIAYGDLIIGTNHTLPTNKAGRYTLGLWVSNGLKTLTYQSVTKEASSMICEYCGRLCKLDWFMGHKGQADIRLRRYGGELG